MVDNRCLDSPYGKVIHYDVDLDYIPANPELLLRSIRAYWDHVVRGAYPGNLAGSRVRSLFLCEALWQRGWADRYPDTLPRLVVLNYSLDKYAEARDFQEQWCQRIHLTADLQTLSQELWFYLNELGGSYDKVADWCRRRAEQDRLRGDVPVGMALLRHHLMMQHFHNERRADENSHEFWQRMYRVYRLVPMGVNQITGFNWHRTSLVTQISVKEPQPPEDWERAEIRPRANSSNLIALSYVLDGTWTWDTAETIAGWQKKWEEECAEIRTDEDSFGKDWFEKEKEKAAEIGRTYHAKGLVRREGRGLYMAGLAHYATKNTDGAIALMRQACDKDCYEAMGWLERHEIDFVGQNYIWPYQEMFDLEKLADRLYGSSDAGGLQELAEALEQGSDLFDPQPEAAALLRQETAPLREEADILDQIFASGRQNALKLANQMLQVGKEQPELAVSMLRYHLLVHLQIARADGVLKLEEALDFVAVDMGQDPEYDRLVESARSEDWDAVYHLCERYAKDPRLGGNPYLEAVVYHLGRSLCQIYRGIYHRIQEETRKGVLTDWVRIVLWMKEYGDPEPIRIGLYQDDPFCCSLLADENLVSVLGLEKRLVIEYLQIAQRHGFDVEQTLEQYIGSSRDFYTEDFFRQRLEWRCQQRQKARSWMAEVNRILQDAPEQSDHEIVSAVAEYVEEEA